MGLLRNVQKPQIPLLYDGLNLKDLIENRM